MIIATVVLMILCVTLVFTMIFDLQGLQSVLSTIGIYIVGLMILTVILWFAIEGIVILMPQKEVTKMKARTQGCPLTTYREQMIPKFNVGDSVCLKQDIAKGNLIKYTILEYTVYSTWINYKLINSNTGSTRDVHTDVMIDYSEAKAQLCTNDCRWEWCCYER